MGSSLPFNPRTDDAVAIAPLVDEYLATKHKTLGNCDQCGTEIVINQTTADFAGRHETPIICTDCAQSFAKGDI